MMNRYPRTGYGRGQPLPGWAASIASDTWTTLPNTQMLSWANGGGIPAGAYRGTSAFSAMVDAYGEPAYDGAAMYFYGGGHGDGSCNAVAKFDLTSLAWTLVGQPTPPSVYLPDYMNTAANVLYPSGLTFNVWGNQTYPFSGFFLDAANLPNPVDAAYVAPALARVSTHMYQAACKRGSVIHYFYLAYGEFDTSTGTWSQNAVNLASQIYALGTQYGNWPIAWGAVTIYDEVADRIFVTLTPGDGGGARSAILVFNPITRQVEAIYDSGSFGNLGNAPSVVRVGRELYCFTKVGANGSPQIMNQGVVFNMDTRTYWSFKVSGASTSDTQYLSGVAVDGSGIDSIPAWYDGVAIRRWNYSTATRANIYSVSTVPTSGTGTAVDPLILPQTVRTLSGTPPSSVQWVYGRFSYNAVTRCAVLIPHASADFVAIKLS